MPLKMKVLRISVGYLCLCIAAGGFETETSSEHSSCKVSGEGPEPSAARLWESNSHVEQDGSELEVKMD